MYKDIPGYEGLYKIDECGNVWSYPRKTTAGKKLKNRFSSGYPRVGLSRDGEVANFSVHSLVAIVFIGIPPEGKEINHKDGDKSNPRLENLEYVTRSENAIHSRRVLKNIGGVFPGILHKNHKLTDADVVRIRNTPIVRKYGHFAALAKQYGVDRTLILRIVQRKSWKHI